ncbi:MAG: ArgE/DapE family deacylase [candidate division KSB1 bacterium]|nr:ArgE/DapE family deacylase [candidate division KSB1 bacterium]MDZ7334884.1 ArgE/DapE family deacylase [candidate division KSB1 bacterium]MDZ7357338.1 ArgE/DapE family deacylase [candidate division KSB1 bacterium]MDZ7376378.1 ArgE/DapE family deacylase [candidate division KSB1 bacterium]MDZ7399340.1 ArgE/DapE family deacylase [candidate division KSB1 bacterium]
MNLHRKINQYFQDHRKAIEQRIIELVTEMVRQRTVNVIPEKLPEHPYLRVRGEEYRVAEIVKRELSRLGIPFDEFARQRERPNIIGKLGKNVSGKRLLLPAHMDVVPAGEGWEHNAFDVVVKDGKLYGRGTNDNKGPLAAILLASAVIKQLELDQQLNGQLLIAALADEEAADPNGVDYGIGYLLEGRLINPTHAIVPDIGHEMREIDIAEKGRMVIRISAFGQQAHGSTPEKGINAIFMMAKLIPLLEQLQFEYHPHPLLGGPTLNLGEIHGGVAANVVPANCSIYLDIRTVPGMDRTGVLDQIHRCIDRIPGGNFQVEILSESLPFSVSADNELVKLIQKYTESELGFIATPMGMGGGTYAKNLIQHGVLTVGWGPGGDTAHIANEYIELLQLVDFARLSVLIAIDLLQ